MRESHASTLVMLAGWMGKMVFLRKTGRRDDSAECPQWPAVRDMAYLNTIGTPAW